MSLPSDPVQRHNAVSFWRFASAAAFVSTFFVFFSFLTFLGWNEHHYRTGLHIILPFHCFTMLSLGILLVLPLVGVLKNGLLTMARVVSAAFVFTQVFGIYTAYCGPHKNDMNGFENVYHWLAIANVAVATCPIACSLFPKSRFAFHVLPFPQE